MIDLDMQNGLNYDDLLNAYKDKVIYKKSYEKLQLDYSIS